MADQCLYFSTRKNVSVSNLEVVINLRETCFMKASQNAENLKS